MSDVMFPLEGVMLESLRCIVPKRKERVRLNRGTFFQEAATEAVDTVHRQEETYKEKERA